MAPQRNSKRSFDILPEPIETSTRSVRQKMPESQANPQSHAKSFLPIPIQSSKRSHRTTAGNTSSPLTSSNLSAMLASLDDQNGSNRVSPRSLPSSACPSLSTSPGSTTSSMASFEHAHHASRHHGVNTPNVNVQLGVLDENNEEEIVGKTSVDTPATPEEASRVFPKETPVRVGGYNNIGGDARVDNKNHPHDNNNHNGNPQPTKDASGVLAPSTSARANETQITSEDSKRVVDTPKPKNILITSTHALVESPMKKPSHFSWNKDNNIKRSPSPCLWSSPAPSRSPSPSLWCTTTSNAYRSKQAPPPPETKMSTSSSTSTSSNSTELTVPPSSSSSTDDEKIEISTSKISLWRPASQEQRAASPCLWTKSSVSTASSTTAKCVKILPTYQATETVVDEPPSLSNLCPSKPCEVSCEFVQQVYRYLSFDHECMARGYDYELADISGLSMAEVKADRFNALKKYVEDYIGRVPGIRTGQGW